MREGLPTLSEARDAFLDDVGIALSPLTQRTYRSKLRILTDADWPLSKTVCRRLIADQVRAKRATATVQTMAGALASFGKWLMAQGYAAANPMHGVPVPKRDKDRPHRYLSFDEVGRLRAACKTDQERLIVALLCTGLRAAELLSVRVEDIADGLILVRGKGARWRYVPLPAEAIPLLPPSGRLVPIGYKALLYHVHKLGRRAGIPRLHPHVLRHTFASHGVRELDVPTIAAVGGWATISMVERYAKSTYQQAAARKAAKLRLIR